MLTSRGWWLLTTVTVLLATGLVFRLPLLSLSGLALLLWLSWEWLLFTLRVSTMRRGLSVLRTVSDQRGPVSTLWAGRGFTVRVELRAARLRLAYVVVSDRVPFGVTWQSGETSYEGEVDDRHIPLLTYHIHCDRPGLARFEGLKVQTADLQGFFYHVSFVRSPMELLVLPCLVDSEGRPATTKRFNLLPPPGIHRLHKPGTGSELLDLRDYLPGDPPRTIAWKISARRDRLITKEFETEVPVRCTLFVDTSDSVLVPTLEGKAIQRLVDIAASVIQAGNASRDLTGLCLIDVQGVAAWLQPGRTGRKVAEMFQVLARAAAPTASNYRVEPELLLPLAYTFAREVYPDRFRRAINSMPFWVSWFMPFPRYTRSRATLAQFVHRRKNLAWVLFPVVAPLVWLVAHTCTERGRRLGFWRKQLAAFLSVRYGVAPGGLALLLEDDDQFALLLQRFLSEHQVPVSLPMYDPEGHYLYAAPGKVDKFAHALLRAVRHGQDNELFVLLVDLLELDDHLAPLVQAVRVAVSRHHQVLLICPWPAGLELPSRTDASATAVAEPLHHGAETSLMDLLRRLNVRRFHAAYRRLRRTFGRLGVQVVCAGAAEPVGLVLARMDRLRQAGRRR